MVIKCLNYIHLRMNLQRGSPLPNATEPRGTFFRWCSSYISKGKNYLCSSWHVFSSGCLLVGLPTSLWGREPFNFSINRFVIFFCWNVVHKYSLYSLCFFSLPCLIGTWTMFLDSDAGSFSVFIPSFAEGPTSGSFVFCWGCSSGKKTF